MALKLSRRGLLGGLGSLGALGLAGCAAIARPQAAAPASSAAAMTGMDHGAGIAHSQGNILVGDVDPAVNGFDPLAMLTDFDYGQVSTLPSGQTLREYTIYAADKLIQVAPGISFPAWTYNGRVPGRPSAPPRATGCG